MIQDVEAGRRTEIDYLNGAAVRKGHSRGIATPYNDMISHLIRAERPALSPGELNISTRPRMNMQNFMEGYKAAWEERDPSAFAALFHVDGQYHNTPFQVQRGKAELSEYWKRVQLQEDVHVSFEVLASGPDFGVAHWHVTYQVASEELFEIWARSTGTSQLARQPGDALPRMVLDGVLEAKFVEDHCMEARIWWHSMPQTA